MTDEEWENLKNFFEKLNENIDKVNEELFSRIKELQIEIIEGQTPRMQIAKALTAIAMAEEKQEREKNNETKPTDEV